MVSPGAWQQLLAQREVAASVETLLPSQNSEPLLVHRRHLKAGMTQVAQMLWRREIS